MNMARCLSLLTCAFVLHQDWKGIPQDAAALYKARMDAQPGTSNFAAVHDKIRLATGDQERAKHAATGSPSPSNRAPRKRKGGRKKTT